METQNNIPDSQDRNGRISDDFTKDIEEVDSPINKDFDTPSSDNQSLTLDEDADTDPNEVDDKPSFKNDNQ